MQSASSRHHSTHEVVRQVPKRSRRHRSLSQVNVAKETVNQSEPPLSQNTSTVENTNEQSIDIIHLTGNSEANKIVRHHPDSVSFMNRLLYG
jgi:hypothetical protein